MDATLERRLCDGVSGAATAGAIVGLALGHWYGFVVCLVAGAVAQVIRADV